MPPCVTIIVPIYNAQATLHRCVESVLNQEFTDFELVLADDGSQDGSAVLCDQFAQADSRVRVLHKANSGVSDTRNQAMAQARGEYLQFLDADDWITPNATKLLVRSARQHQCDLVVADFYRVVGERVSPKGDIDEEGPFTREEFAAHMMENPADFYYGVLWNKLYRRTIIEAGRLRFQRELSWCEDFLFNLEYLKHVRLAAAVPEPVYYYVRRENSLVMTESTPRKALQIKRKTFAYYKRLYQQLDLYEEQKGAVYRYLLSVATDGGRAALPEFMDRWKRRERRR